MPARKKSCLSRKVRRDSGTPKRRSEMSEDDGMSEREGKRLRQNEGQIEQIDQVTPRELFEVQRLSLDIIALDVGVQRMHLRSDADSEEVRLAERRARMDQWMRAAAERRNQREREEGLRAVQFNSAALGIPLCDPQLEVRRLRRRSARIAEAIDAKSRRQAEDAMRHASKRANESPDFRQQRLSGNANRNSTNRAAERPETRQLRLQENRLRDTTRRARNRQFQWKDLAFNYTPELNLRTDPKVAVGNMYLVCCFCGAKLFQGETRLFCCFGGKVKLPPLIPPPEPLKSLMNGSDPRSTEFLADIRKYNSCFNMTSFGCGKRIQGGQQWMPTFKIQGQAYHLIGSLLPPEPSDPESWISVYFIEDRNEQTERRHQRLPELRSDIIHELQDLLHIHNPYVQLFKTGREMMLQNDEFRVVIREDRTPVGEHPRRFNAPTTSGVGAVMVGEEAIGRDIVLQLRSDQPPRRIFETHRAYMPLQYPLMFWQGEDGYHFNIPLTRSDVECEVATNGAVDNDEEVAEVLVQDAAVGENTTRKRQLTVSNMQFNRYRLMVRDENQNHILRCGKLLQMFLTDAFSGILSERCLWVRLNQTKIRREMEIDLRHAVQNNERPENIGQPVILPSSFTGSNRQIHEHVQDGMTYVKAGKPDLFITFTCNQNWPEISENIFDGQLPNDRHDIIARVFHLKVKKFVDLITKAGIFGDVRCWLYTIEWQKRGLPHLHMLVFLKENIHAGDIDRIISAELPDPDGPDRDLFLLVKKHMIHGPCGHWNPECPCMKERKCTKSFPKALVSDTVTSRDGYPQYRRRRVEDGGFATTLKLGRGPNSGKEVPLDNSWVVPYNPLLLKLFDAHINVEYCYSLRTIKYLNKYLHKGSDQAMIEVKTPDGARDEVAEYQHGRYISSNEGAWRIFGFEIHGRFPTVMKLVVHLEHRQQIIFNPNDVEMQLNNPRETTLTAFFKLCREDNFCKTLLYPNVGAYYVFSKNEFRRRKQGVPVARFDGVVKSAALSRVYAVSPSQGELFYLRLLLHHVTGPTSFEHIRTVDGLVCETFQEACLKLQLLEDDSHWKETMMEGQIYKSAGKMRHLFALLLTTNAMSNPMELWETFKADMSDDILLEHQRMSRNPNLDLSEDHFNEALRRINELCKKMDGRLITAYLPQIDKNILIAASVNPEILAERAYNREQLKGFVDEKVPLLNQDQSMAYQRILENVQSGTGGIFFLDAPGGTGKTFLINLLLAKYRSEGRIAIASASSGIAATLLQGGRTAHSLFRIPIDLISTDKPTCSVSKNSDRSELLKEASIIIWDECTMAHKRALEAVNRCLKDIKGSGEIMGGTTLLLSGDFRQTLPVVPRSTPADEVAACLTSSELWRKVTTLKLTVNMRVQLCGDPEATSFAARLLELGEGRFSEEGPEKLIDVSSLGTIVNTVDEMVEAVYPNLPLNFHNHEWLKERCIIAPKNMSVGELNHQIQILLPGEVRRYKSIDTLANPEDVLNYPLEFLNSQDVPGIPSHILDLKIGSPIILLRNLDPPHLCNGTRLVVRLLHDHLIAATILTGPGAGEDVLIPRLRFTPTGMPYEFRRVQFPVRLAFAMSINKSQGQTMRVCGVYLATPCFSHGQLYVAASRVGDPKGLYFFASEGKTKNVVYANAIKH